MYDPSGELTDTNHYLVIPKVRKRLSVRKQAALKIDVDNELEIRK
jgi:hypothetical protein